MIKRSNNIAFIVDAVDKSAGIVTIIRLGDFLKEKIDQEMISIYYFVVEDKEFSKEIVRYGKNIKNKEKILKVDVENKAIVLVNSKDIQQELLQNMDLELQMLIKSSNRKNMIVSDNIDLLIDKEKESIKNYIDTRREQDEKAATYQVKFINDIKKFQEEHSSEPKTASDDNDSFIIIQPDNQIKMTDVITQNKTLCSIEQEFSRFELADFFNDDWGLNAISPINQGCYLNFYGPSGTGKTLTVRAFANKLNRPIIQVDFSQLISKYIGDTGKNIKKYFNKAKELNAILFFDEADSLMMKRVSSGSDQNSSTVNQNQNIFMQEVDRFNGIIILATNFFQNYDEAVARRFTSIQFYLPDDQLRYKLFEKHLSNKVVLDESFSIQALVHLTKGFSGAEIKSVCINALINKATKFKLDNPSLTKNELIQELKFMPIGIDSFRTEIERIQESKKFNAGHQDRPKIGLNS